MDLLFKHITGLLAADSPLNLRRLNTEELQILWGVIPYSIEDPVFILENSRHKILIQLDEARQLFYVDDYFGVSINQDKAAAEPNNELLSLYAAIHVADAAQLQALIDTGIDVTTSDVGGNFALLYACDQLQLDMARLLLAAGADPNQQNNDGDTPLLYAVAGNHLQLVELLVAAGADVNTRNALQLFPFLIASLRGYQDIADYLSEHGAVP